MGRNLRRPALGDQGRDQQESDGTGWITFHWASQFSSVFINILDCLQGASPAPGRQLGDVAGEIVQVVGADGVQGAVLVSFAGEG